MRSVFVATHTHTPCTYVWRIGKPAAAAAANALLLSRSASRGPEPDWSLTRSLTRRSNFLCHSLGRSAGRRHYFFVLNGPCFYPVSSVIKLSVRPPAPARSPCDFLSFLVTSGNCALDSRAPTSESQENVICSKTRTYAHTLLRLDVAL